MGVGSERERERDKGRESEMGPSSISSFSFSFALSTIDREICVSVNALIANFKKATIWTMARFGVTELYCCCMGVIAIISGWINTKIHFAW